MNHDEFVGQVQHRAQLASRGDAETIIRVTLETLHERMQPEAASHVAAQLPAEIGRSLRGQGQFEHLTLQDFLRRVAVREDATIEKAVFHVRCVLEVVEMAISPGAFRKLENQLPQDFRAALLPSPARREMVHAGGNA
ncbi:MAG TPA: DUF2267 domain-containing protein [Thermoanaerobaculia bacterium]|nr:DUF2267 domain-containing protein [Thermoanaerobaculia bacterium]